MQGEAAQAEFAACVRCDPVLALRLRLLPADFGTQQDLLRALLLAAPVAAGAAQVTYAARWRQSISVAHLAQTLAVRSGVVDAEAAWAAGLSHNLTEYLETDIVPPAHAADWLDGAGPRRLAGRRGALPRRAAGARARSASAGAHRPAGLSTGDPRRCGGQRGCARRARHPAAWAQAKRPSCWPTARPRRASWPCASGWSTPWRNQMARALTVSPACMRCRRRNRPAQPFSLRHDGASQVFVLLQDSLRALFGIERACLFAPATDGTLRLSALIPAASGLNALAIPPDDGHSALPRALARNAPQQFERGASGCGAGR